MPWKGRLALTGLRQCRKPPNIYFRRKKTGGISFNATLPLTHMDEKLVQRILQVRPPPQPPPSGQRPLASSAATSKPDLRCTETVVVVAALHSQCSAAATPAFQHL